jgi:hypothetical protein
VRRFATRPLTRRFTNCTDVDESRMGPSGAS